MSSIRHNIMKCPCTAPACNSTNCPPQERSLPPTVVYKVSAVFICMSSPTIPCKVSWENSAARTAAPACARPGDTCNITGRDIDPVTVRRKIGSQDPFAVDAERISARIFSRTRTIGRHHPSSIHSSSAHTCRNTLLQLLQGVMLLLQNNNRTTA